MRSSIPIIIITFALLSEKSAAQVNSASFLKNISIRKTFDGSKKDEAKPASFVYNRDFKQKTDFYTVDLGIKLSEFELTPNSAVLTVAPNIEYHADKRDTFKVHTLSGGLNIQYQFLDPAKYKYSPQFLVSTSYQGDFVKNDNVFKTKGYLTVISGEGLKPSVGMYNSKMTWYFRYYPYVGLEYYKKANEKQDVTSTYLTGRLFFELWPGSIRAVEKEDPQTGTKTTAYLNYLQLTFDYSIRNGLKDEYFKVNQNHWLSIGLNYYPSGSDKIGLGLEYAEGYDPTTNFAKTDRLSLGIKVKI